MHAFKYGKQHPLINAFFPSKHRSAYERVMNLIRQKTDPLQLTLNPQTVVSGFKLAINKQFS